MATEEHDVKTDTSAKIDTYRVGVGHSRIRGRWGRFHTDKLGRTWQAEWDETLWCPRAWSRAGVLRKARRWQRNHTDLRRHERRYGTNLVARAMRGL